MIRLDNVTVAYAPGAPALDQVSLALECGRFTVLLGPSGAGKSTLLRSLNGLIAPTSGRVETLDGGPILASRERLKAHRQTTAMVFQQHHLVGRASAHANVVAGRLGHMRRIHALMPPPKADQLLAFEALERVGLLDKSLQRADRLSGGEQQRVGIARALVQRPNLLLADEPVASLDPATSDAILQLLLRVAREDGITAVVSLHQVELALKVADRIIGLNRGRVVFDGPPAALDANALARIYAGPGPISPPARAEAAADAAVVAARAPLVAAGES
ncbi:MAG: phosphonate ABC transporter ATP-binding protein [Pseudomonadota bacterium]